MPILKVTFQDVPIGTYGVRAFASNIYGEGQAYPPSMIGPLPSSGGLS